jgi:hypothetical protein
MPLHPIAPGPMSRRLAGALVVLLVCVLQGCASLPATVTPSVTTADFVTREEPGATLLSRPWLCMLSHFVGEELL